MPFGMLCKCFSQSTLAETSTAYVIDNHRFRQFGSPTPLRYALPSPLRYATPGQPPGYRELYVRDVTSSDLMENRISLAIVFKGVPPSGACQIRYITGSADPASYRLGSNQTAPITAVLEVPAASQTHMAWRATNDAPINGSVVYRKYGENISPFTPGFGTPGFEDAIAQSMVHTESIDFSEALDEINDANALTLNLTAAYTAWKTSLGTSTNQYPSGNPAIDAISQFSVFEFQIRMPWDFADDQGALLSDTFLASFRPIDAVLPDGSIVFLD